MDPDKAGQTPSGAALPAWGPPPAPDRRDAAPLPASGPRTPAASPWSGIAKRIPAAVGAVIIAMVALELIRQTLTASPNGKVIFTTDAPTASGAQTCQLGNQVTSVLAGTAVYANYFYKSPLVGETVTRTITKDGSILDTYTLPSGQSNGIPCLESTENLSVLAPGVYEFKLTSLKGDVVSDGTLTVK